MATNSGYEFWRTVLKEAKYVVAPMVDQSELAWRVLSRRYGAQLCYTPMINSKMFVGAHGNRYRSEIFTTNETDRPLIAQLCGNDPDIVLQAAKMIEDKVDAIDLNLGCPQGIARKGHYGAFLQDEWDLIEKILVKLRENLSIPVTCKIRVFNDEAKTLEYVKMIEKTGVQILTVHGRTREQKGHNTGIADWSIIKKIKETVSIPVFANGNILYHEDIEACMKETGVDGVMAAEGNLCNPAIFRSDFVPTVFDMALEYLEICKEIPTPLSYQRAHLFRLLKPCLSENIDLRNRLGPCDSWEGFVEIVQELKGRLTKLMEEEKDEDVRTGKKYSLEEDSNVKRIYPTWLCQPYFRKPMPEAHEKKEKGEEISCNNKRCRLEE